MFKTILHKGTQNTIFTDLYKQWSFELFFFIPLLLTLYVAPLVSSEKTSTQFGTSSSLWWVPAYIPDINISEKVWFPPIHALLLFNHKLPRTSALTQAPFIIVLPKTLQEVSEYVFIAWHFPIPCGKHIRSGTIKNYYCQEITML
jgi:hypothetical protein